MISRRSALRVGLGAAVAATAGVAAGGIRSAARADQPNWGALCKQLTGALVLPGDSGYAVAKEIQYAQYAYINPMAVAFCETVQDVQACVRFARSNGLQAAPRSGGHSLGGYSLSPGLVIDVSKLSWVRPAASAVSVGAGVPMIDLLVGLSALGVALPQAPEPTVGTAGFVQGGGVGFESRQFGLASDHLLSADLVLADGSAVHCSPEQNTDLFWALRGGGGGNFGIVTQFQFRPATIPQMTNFSLTWDWDQIHQVQPAWQEWTIGGSRDVSASLLIILGNVPGATSGGGSTTVPQVALVGAALAGLDKANAELDALVSAAGTPTSRTVQELNRRDGMIQQFDCSAITVSQCHRQGTTPDGELPTFGFTIERNRLFDRGLSSAALDQAISVYQSGFQAGQIRLFEFVALGGAINDISRTETAYVHRSSQFFVRTGFGLPAASPPAADIAAGRAWIDDLFTVINEFSDSESFQNFIDPSLADWTASYYAENYARLRGVKRHYDPDNFFRFAQSIRP
jgi:FAD/FMN-containing dehydrogenase